MSNSIKQRLSCGRCYTFIYYYRWWLDYYTEIIDKRARIESDLVEKENAEEEVEREREAVLLRAAYDKVVRVL